MSANQSNGEVRIPTQALHQWIIDLFVAAGSNQTEATLLADHLVGANLAGHDSHGIGMAPRYVKALLDGDLVLNKTIDWVVDTGAMLVADAGLGLGQATAYQAMQKAIERAREHGICLLGLRNSHHIGRVGHWAEMAIAADLASIHFTSALGRTPGVAPHGGYDARFLTNPLTIGIPRGEDDPFVLDFATSAIAHGKVRVAHNKGEPVRSGALVNSDGEPTTDSSVLFREPRGALKTFSEHKGHALAMAVELLAAAMTGGPTMRPDNYSNGWGAWNNMLAIVFDPQRLNTADAFQAETNAFIEWVKSSRKDAAGQALGDILIPGDPERRMRKLRAQEMPVDAGTMAEMDESAALVNEHFKGAVPPLTTLIV